MGYISVAPFGRAIDHAQMARLRQQTTAPSPRIGSVNKWEILRDIGTARAELALSDRDVSVLQALLSFHPSADLDGAMGEMIVYPSNASICARLNGMAESTMRRHLGQLISSGLLSRRDSPNGKRYLRRSRAGHMAFGFDLYPLRQRSQEIRALAEAARDRADQISHLRQSISLMRRDLMALLTWATDEHPDAFPWQPLEQHAQDLSRNLRRRLGLPELIHLQEALAAALSEVKTQLNIAETAKLSSNDAEIEQHHQNSDKEYLESKTCAEAASNPSPVRPTEHKSEPRSSDTRMPEAQSQLPLRLVLSHCPEVQSYAQTPIASWRDLMSTCETLRPMMGISSDVWSHAKRSLGAGDAAVVLSAMLERISKIRSPGGYLRHLCQKAERGIFSTGPMMMALIQRST